MSIVSYCKLFKDSVKKCECHNVFSIKYINTSFGEPHFYGVNFKREKNMNIFVKNLEFFFHLFLT